MKRFSLLSVCLCFAMSFALAPSPMLGQVLPARVPAPLPANASSYRLIAAAAAPAQAEQNSGSEVDTDIYRHSTAVRAIARVLHVDPEAAAEIFEYSNFAILAIFILILIFKYFPKMLRDRRHRIQEKLAEARTATQQAKDRLQAVESQFARLDEEIARIRTQAEQESAAEEERIKALIEIERQRIIASADQEIRSSVAAARRDLKRFASDLAVDRAERMISLTEETDQALLRQFAGRLDEQSGNGGGRE